MNQVIPDSLLAQHPVLMIVMTLIAISLVVMIARAK
jgi:hypothetical protein